MLVCTNTPIGLGTYRKLIYWYTFMYHLGSAISISREMLWQISPGPIFQISYAKGICIYRVNIPAKLIRRQGRLALPELMRGEDQRSLGKSRRGRGKSFDFLGPLQTYPISRSLDRIVESGDGLVESGDGIVESGNRIVESWRLRPRIVELQRYNIEIQRSWT